MVETEYLLIGWPAQQHRPNPPWNNITDSMDIGQTITLDLTTEDETALINAGVIEPIAWTQHHTLLQ